VRRVNTPKLSKIHLLATYLDTSKSTVVPMMAEKAEIIFC
jgi:hypothetical protein